MQSPQSLDPSIAASPADALAQIWQVCDLPRVALEHARLSGANAVLPSTFAVGTAAQAAIAAAGLAAAALRQARGGAWQTVAVDMLDAAVECRSERYVQVDGRLPVDPWDKIAGLYRCADGWVRLHGAAAATARVQPCALVSNWRRAPMP